MIPNAPTTDIDFIQLPNGSRVGAKSLEQLVRPLLELLHAVTGMQSAFLTFVDGTAGEQRVLYAHNSSSELHMPEQLVVPWADTLCRRALMEGCCFSNDVAVCWGDSVVAREMGITSYATAPVRAADGSLFGTLCAASSHTLENVESVTHLLAMFAQLVSQHIERESLIAQLRKAHEALRQSADTDVLTGLPNRRALLQEIERRLTQHAQAGTDLVVSFIDLDGFKAINDLYGHVIGDRFLVAVAEKLRRGQRPEDYCARLGGDEFVTLTSLGHIEVPNIEDQLRSRLHAATSGKFDIGDGLVIEYHGASIGLTRAHGETRALPLLNRADSAMYNDKLRRRNLNQTP